MSYVVEGDVRKYNDVIEASGQFGDAKKANLTQKVVPITTTPSLFHKD